MEYIDKVYYINLDHRKDRYEEMEKVLDELEVPKEKRHRISAVHNPEHGIVGCHESFINTIETFINSGHNTCLMFEDDFMFENKERFLDSLKYIFENKVDFDAIQLSYNQCDCIDTEHPILKKVKTSQTLSSLLLHKNFAPILLENFKESHKLLTEFIKTYGHKNHYYCHDIYWHKIQNQSKWFCVSPRLGFQRASFSDIEKRIVNYGC